MKALINLLKGFFDGVMGVIEFVISTIEDLVYIVGLIGEFLGNIPSYFSWLPPEGIGLIVTAFSIVGIYVIANRK